MIKFQSLHHFPISPGVGVHGRALEQQGGGTITEGTVYNIGVAGDPANIGNTAKYLSITVVKHMLKSKENTCN